MEKKNKTVIEQVKELFNTDVKVKFEEVKTTEGIVLNISAKEAGGEISVIDEDGSNPAPVGEYVLEDGSSIVVSEEGVIAEIKEADAEIEKEEEEDMEAEKEEKPVDAPKEEVNPLDGRVDALESKLDSILSKFSEQKEMFSKPAIVLAEELDNLKKDFEAFKALPSEAPIKIEKKIMSRADRINANRRK